MVDYDRRIDSMKTKTLLSDYTILESLGMHQLGAYTTEDAWYGWLINQYIPDQGRKDMDVFISIGFDPMQYILWKLLEQSKVESPVLAVELRRRFRDTHGVCDLMENGRCKHKE